MPIVLFNLLIRTFSFLGFEEEVVLLAHWFLPDSCLLSLESLYSHHSRRSEQAYRGQYLELTERAGIPD